MARRYIGNATIYIQYHDDGDYRGSVVVFDGYHKAWKFRDLRPAVVGFGPGIAYDSSEAYDQMAQTAVNFGSYYSASKTACNLHFKHEEEKEEVAAAIREATVIALREDGYEVRRSRT